MIRAKDYFLISTISIAVVRLTTQKGYDCTVYIVVNKQMRARVGI